MSRKKGQRLPVLEDLYERYGQDLFRYLLFKLGTPEDAEDVLQEIFCRFARYTIRWKLIRDRRSFVFRVARNEAHRCLRRRIGRREGERTIAAARAAFSAAVAAPGDRARSWLLARADALPEEQREIIFLKVFEGLTFKEIGSTCGLSTNTAASRYRYGIAKLREAVKERPC